MIAVKNTAAIVFFNLKLLFFTFHDLLISVDVFIKIRVEISIYRPGRCFYKPWASISKFRSKMCSNGKKNVFKLCTVFARNYFLLCFITVIMDVLQLLGVMLKGPLTTNVYSKRRGDLMEKLSNTQLEIEAYKARKAAVQMVHDASSGHPGGSLSCLDVLTTLYFDTMNIDPADPKNEDRDRFVMSKGHCSPALYPVLALRGFFPVEELKMFRSIDGHMSGHVEMKHVKGVDMSTGSLGQGISTAVGMALAGKIGKKDYRVYSILGDGEVAEGQVWEAMMSAAKYNLDNLCAIVDVNGLQIDGATKDVMPSEPLDKKFEAFGMNVIKIDGHNFEEIRDAFAKAKECKGKPTVILAKTIKGKGVSYMENQAGWHGKAPNDEQYEQAEKELDAHIAELEAK